MRYARPLLLAVGLLLVLGAANYDIMRKERTLADGTQILLELRPADPRSLLQGDYMALRYARTTLPPANIDNNALSRRGAVIVKVGADGVAQFARLDDGTPLGTGELRLNYKRRLYEQEVSYGADSFFFQEGDAESYSDAKYGVLRVDADGNSILVGLAGADRNLLTPH